MGLGAVEGGGPDQQGPPHPRLKPCTGQEGFGAKSGWAAVHVLRADVAVKGTVWVSSAPPRSESWGRQDLEPTPSPSHLDFIIFLSIGKFKGMDLHCAGHRGPGAGRRGAPFFLVQALPGAMDLR